MRVPPHMIDAAGQPDGRILQTSGEEATWGPAPSGGGGATTLDGLSDVDTTTTPPIDGSVLTFDGASGLWTPGDIAAGSSLPRQDDPSDPLWTGNLGYDYEFTGDDTSGQLPSGWSWFNQGPATYVQQFGAGVMRSPGVPGNNLSLIDRPLPSEAAWVAKAKVAVQSYNANYMTVGMVLRSNDGKLITFGNGTSWGQVEVDKWASVTTYDSRPQGPAGVVMDFNYLGIQRNSATSWDFLVSHDGIAWTKFLANYNVSAWHTPTRLGFVIHRVGSYDTALSIHWFRVRAAA